MVSDSVGAVPGGDSGQVQAALFARAVLGHEVAGRVSQAIVDHQAGRLLEAARAYQQVLAADPDNLTALNNLSLLLADPRQAIELLLKALSLAPAYVDAWINLGVRRLATGESQQARQALESARVLAPHDPRVERALGAAMVLPPLERTA